MLHASGKFVPAILSKLEPTLEQEEADFLRQFQDSVVKHCGMADDDGDERARLGEEMSGQLSRLREVAASKKKRANDNDDD